MSKVKLLLDVVEDIAVQSDDDEPQYAAEESTVTMKAKDISVLPQMPIKVTPYAHQQKAYEFTCGLFGLIVEGGDTFGDGKSEMLPLREDVPKEKD